MTPDPVSNDPPALAALKPWAIAIRNTIGYALGAAMIGVMVAHWYFTNQAPPAEFVPLAGLLVGANVIAPAISPFVGQIVTAMRGKKGA